MKLLYPLLFVFSLLAISCDDNDKEIRDLTFTYDNYNGMFGMNSYIPVQSGNGSYTITITDTTIVKASYSPTYGAYGIIDIFGAKKGETNLTVLDNITKQEVVLKITITDAYISVFVKSTEARVEINSDSDRKLITEDIMKSPRLLQNVNILTFVQRENSDFFIFNNKDEAIAGKIKHKGNYKFVSKGNETYLILKIITDEKAETETQFLLSGNGCKNLVSFLLEKQTKAQESKLIVNMSEDLTAKYNINYPKLESANLYTSSIIGNLNEVQLKPEILD